MDQFKTVETQESHECNPTEVEHFRLMVQVNVNNYISETLKQVSSPLTNPI